MLKKMMNQGRVKGGHVSCWLPTGRASAVVTTYRADNKSRSCAHRDSFGRHLKKAQRRHGVQPEQPSQHSGASA